MVIQRWQSVLLFIAAILVACSLFAPMAKINETYLSLTQFPVLMIVDILVAVLVFAAIFMFKNLKKQIKVTRLTMWLTIFMTIGAGVYLYVNYPSATIEICVPITLSISLLLCYLAQRLMQRDYSLLRSADRLR